MSRGYRDRNDSKAGRKTRRCLPAIFGTVICGRRAGCRRFSADFCSLRHKGCRPSGKEKNFVDVVLRSLEWQLAPGALRVVALLRASVVYRRSRREAKAKTRRTSVSRLTAVAPDRAQPVG
jgi:hypothetical protein